MTSIDKAELTQDYPQEFSSYLSIDTPYLDEVSSESSARNQGYCEAAVSISTEDLTNKRKHAASVSRKISRSRSMDRYRSENRRSRSQSGRRVRTRRSCSLRPVDPTSLAPPLDFMVIQYSRQSICPSQCSSRPRSNVSRQPSQRDRKEKKRRRMVLIIMVSFVVLLLASVLVVVVTLTHSSVMKVHNVTSKYYTFAVPPHHPLSKLKNGKCNLFGVYPFNSCFFIPHL